MYLAQNLRYLRKQKGMNQNEIAGVLEISRATVGNWEAGRREPELSMLVRIAEYFGVMIDDLVLKDFGPPIPLYVSNIKYLRKKHEMTQDDMAIFLGFKGKSSLCAVETGKVGLSVENLGKLADFFGVTLDQLVKQDLSKEAKFNGKAE